MKTPITVALTLLAAVAASASDLPTGSFKGRSALIHGADVMALIIQKDPANPQAGWAILAEYDRTIASKGGGIEWDRRLPAPERIQLTRWVFRLYAYRLEPAGQKRWSLRPLKIAGTQIAPDATVTPSVLALAKDGTLEGATMTRYEKGSVLAAETISFFGGLSSTWENFVPGDYFLAHDTTGGEYFSKGHNMSISKDMVAEYAAPEIAGKFDVLATDVPKLFAFRAQSAANKGSEKLVGRIAVFIDIVNWKPVFRTNELLVINPDDARDLGFYYQRGQTPLGK